MDAVPEQTPISGLAVACVETVLEHGRLDVVAFVLFFWRKALDLLPEQICLDVLVLEVAPASLVIPWDAPPLSCSLLGDGLDSLVGVACRNLPDGKSVFIVWNQFPAAPSLHLASLDAACHHGSWQTRGSQDFGRLRQHTSPLWWNR